MSRTAVTEVLAARVQVMLRMLLGPPLGVHGTLMQREMADPTEALPVIVDEFIQPFMDEMKAIIARLEPRLDDEALERCATSVVGQALFYRSSMPVVLRIWKRKGYTAELRDQLATHIAEFSVGGMARVAAQGRRARAR